jgi:hypothetical protein
MRPGPAIVIAALLGLSSASAEAQPKPKVNNIEVTEDDVIFARGDALWSMPARGGSASPLVQLPWPAKEVAQLRTSSDGTALLVNARGFTAWAELQRGSEAKLRFLPCSGPSHISADGGRVVCGTQDTRRIAIYTLRPELSVEIIDRKASGPLFFAKDEIISFGDSGDLLAISQKGERVVASHHPQSSMAVSPDGKRAVGDYNEGSIDIVYAFRLDGRASKRTLVHAAKTLDISADSAWVAVQQEVDACAVRVVGGQYMCWRRFKARAISSRGRSLLVSRANGKKQDLYLGAVRGTSSRKPAPLVESVDGAATFWPAPSE